VDAETVLTPEGFEIAQKEWLESQIKIWPARAFYLFDAGHPCDRFKTWRWTMSEAQRPHDYVLQSIFGEGHLHQPDVYNKLDALGFDIVREGMRAKQWTLPGGAVISGRIDGWVRGYRRAKYDPPRLLEIKSSSPHVFASIDRIEDLRNAREHYIRAYYDQGQLGAILEETEHGVFVFKNKLTGMLKVVPFALDYAYAEAMVKRIERLNEIVKAKIDPPPITYDSGICGRCGFEFLCFPPRDAGEGFVRIEDPGLVDDVERRAALEPDKKEYDELDKSVKERLKKLVGPGQTGMLGEFTAEIKEVGKHFKATAERDTTEIHVVIRRVGA